jgi:hypothetical protein
MRLSAGLARLAFPVAVGAIAAALLLAGCAHAAEEGSSGSSAEGKAPAGPAPVAAEQRAPAPVPVYVPPTVGAPLTPIGTSTRGAGRQATLQLLAPDHVGLTTAERPTLYWYLAQPTSTRIDLTIRDERSVEPILDLELPRPTPAGIHAVRLSEHGVRLAVDTSYQWSVSLVPDPAQRSRDFVVSAWLRRSAPAPALRERIAATPDARRVFVLAESGVWYDAIEAASARIASDPGDPTLRMQRAALLEQVGLSDVAEYDRESAPRR